METLAVSNPLPNPPLQATAKNTPRLIGNRSA
jgi:hypothetical protein